MPDSQLAPDAADPSQAELSDNPGALPSAAEPSRALDLFAGIGGLSAGFRDAGFEVTGVDHEETAASVYEAAGFGTMRILDLKVVSCLQKPEVLLGGPPCRPWSPVNQRRRGAAHEDHGLLARFTEHVVGLKPLVFVMENVPALRSDEVYNTSVQRMASAGYDIDAGIVRYDRFGAATRRRRLFTVGVHATLGGGRAFFQCLNDQQCEPQTVRDAIWRFRDIPRGVFPDHDWSELASIGNYRDRYESGRYGWRRLEYDEPAPSFGSVAKTYILHPEAGIGAYPERVLSVREIMAIMGFPDAVRFPAGAARARRYQMIANAVSPIVARAIAAAVRTVLDAGKGSARHTSSLSTTSRDPSRGSLS